MEVEMIAEGLWRWTAAHPDWAPGKDWPRDVGCVYYEAPPAVVLVDPLVPEDEEDRFWRALDGDVGALGRSVLVLQTIHYHERSAEAVAGRYGGTVWRRASGGPLPEGVEGIAVDAADETVFWIGEHRALVPGDVLVEDSGLRLCPADWLPEGRTPDEVASALEAALALPVERVLVSHGRPVLKGGREALARALGHAPSAT